MEKSKGGGANIPKNSLYLRTNTKLTGSPTILFHLNTRAGNIINEQSKFMEISLSGLGLTQVNVNLSPQEGI